MSKRNSSEKTDQGANIWRDLENSDAELREKVGLVLLSWKMTSDYFIPHVPMENSTYIRLNVKMVDLI